jgi:transposase InsO family protein
MAMKERSKQSRAGGGSAGLPADPTPALAGSTSRRYGLAERKALLEELASSSETLKDFCARRRVSGATICAWKRALRLRGEAGLVPRESRRNADGRTARSRNPDERRLAVEAFQRSDMKLDTFARTWGVSPWTLRTWLARYAELGPKGLETRRRGRPPGSGGGFPSVPEAVREEIVRTKRRFPDFGLKKVRDFLRRFQGVKVSTGTVARTLDAHEIDRARPKQRRQKKRPQVRRFERARPGELWQSDITSFVLTRHSTRVYLTVFLDDFSRYVVSFALSTHQRQELVTEALMDGISRFGKPKEVLTDQGRQYFAWRGKSDFQRLLVREGITHVVSRTHHPETLGKCERLWETIGREFWERVQPQDLAEARERLGHFFAHYNFFRPHQGIGGLVPADRFFGAEDALRKTFEAQLSRRELEEALEEAPRKGVYLFGQIGDEQVALSGERGELVVHTSSGMQKRIGLEELGAPPVAQTEASDGREDGNDQQRSDDHERDEAAADRQEAAEVCPSAELPARSQGALDACLARGAGVGTPLVHADPRFVAGQEAARGGLERAPDPAAAGVAAQPAGALGDALGAFAPATAATSQRGDSDGDQGRRSPRAEEEERRARAEARGSGCLDPALDEPSETQERDVGAEDTDLGHENASASSASEG